MRLIDADALIEYIDVGHLRNPLELCFSERAVVDMLERRPTVDAVSVTTEKGGIPMYEPVANFIQRRAETFIEEELLRVTQEMELDVNREELLKALKYDRGQYEKGFRDGVKCTQKYGNWYIRSAYLTEPADSPFREYYMECSECGRKVEGISVEDAINYRKLCREYPYCHCGAKMDGGDVE